MTADRSTVHASAVLVGARAVLIRGPSGSGKSRLALALIAAAQTQLLPFARLVADDRVELEACNGRLLARPHGTLAGLIEMRGLGIRRVPHEPVAAIGIVIDLAGTDAQRMPLPAERETMIAGISLPRLAVASGVDPVPALLAVLGTTEATG